MASLGTPNEARNILDLTPYTLTLTAGLNPLVVISEVRPKSGKEKLTNARCF